MRCAAIAAFLLTACKSPSNKPQKGTEAEEGERIIVPGASDKGPTASSGNPGSGAGSATGNAVPDDPRMHLHDEGTITIDPAKGKQSEKLTATITIRPNPGFHISTDYNTSLKLTAPSDVTLPVTEYKGGGRTHAKGDFETLSEQVLQAVVPAVPGRAGTFTIVGTFRFGICESVSCHPKTQPITIDVVAE